MEPVNSSITTTTTKPNFVFENYSQRIFIAFLFFIVFLLGTIGNSLTILAVVLSKKLQSVTNTFVINLAVSDLLCCLLIPFNIVALIRPENWPKGTQWMCAVAGGGLFVSIGCSVYTLAAIALNRLILITCTRETYGKIFSPTMTTFWVVLLWIIPFCICIFPPLAGVGVLGYNPKYKTCSDISEGYHDNASQNYDIIQACGIFPIPLITIIFCYVSIILYVRKSSNLVRSPNRSKPQAPISKLSQMHSEMETSGYYNEDSFQEKQGSVSGTVSKSSGSLPNNNAQQVGQQEPRRKRPKKMLRADVQVTINLFIVFCVFLICLMPYALCLIFDESDPAIPYTAALLLFNSCMNPIIYAVRFPNFKTVFQFIGRCQWYNIPEPSNLLKTIRDHCWFICCRGRYM